MNNQELMLKVENLIRDKQYDKRFVPMIITFFSLYNEVYNLSESELEEIIHNYSENIDRIEYFNIGRNKNIIEDSRKSLIFDTNYTEKVDENNIYKYLSQSISAQATAVEMLDVTSRSEIKLMQLNAINNLSENKNPIIERLFKMLVASYGTKETRITQIIKGFEHEYNEIENERENPKRNYYNDMIFCIYKFIRDNFEEIYDKGEPNAEICKRIYAFCLYNLQEKIDALGKEEQDIINYQIIKAHMKELQKEYNIEDEELTNITIEKGWELPAEHIDTRIISMLGIRNKQEKQVEKENIKVPVINKDKIIKMLSERLGEKPIEQEEIETLVKQMAIENQYPIEIISLLSEYFKRSAQVYEWDRKTLQKKGENFKLNIKYIKSGKMEEELLSGKVCIKDKALILKDMMLENNSTILGIVFHEMRHATDHTIRDSIVYENGNIIKNKSDKNEFHELDEMLVEGGTQLLTGVQFTDKLHTSFRFNGYENYQYILSMLSSAVGLSEVEFLKLGEKGRVKLEEKLVDIYQNNDIINKINQIDKLLDALPNYTFNFILRKEKAKTLGQIYKICHEMYDMRLEKQQPLTKEEQLKARYEEYKINKNILLIGKAMGFNKKCFEQEVGSSIRKIKDKSKLDRKEKENIKDEIISKKENIRWDNKNPIRDVKAFIKALHRRKTTKKINLLPPVKSEFIEDLKVEQEYYEETLGKEVEQTDSIIMEKEQISDIPLNAEEGQEQE